MRLSGILPSQAIESLLAGASPTGGVGRPRSLAAGRGDRGDETQKRRVPYGKSAQPQLTVVDFGATIDLAVGCPFARRLWSALSPTPHPVFVDFVCPVVSRSERRLVELRVLFFHSIWKLCRRRRFSSDLLEPITETDFEGLEEVARVCSRV
ncbi:BZ3500_MvSof-1268-A1-R1_Chr1-1g00955 [Microbotryum saponariae]|uniref:BZ3500_MvSof-1268-A1-R1_Chr1-1g00955 protein n=1 Tax=Microbotryum saponariae TaxID=289078 RepID=A0A2X0MMG6_9BASI|nr:BZ3500_MvSof-1268-A1-R1_Chr1-1g00955 [Microbotryum saponariae]SCZ93025.1 BZ3501_MvSof-1269-A2-R1_Chr1-1g00552 [Microbotryum saponariae]